MDTTIGVWIEREPREITRCPSYYAADWETLRTEPGIYPVTYDGQTFMYVAIPANRIAGKLYSGFGGVNYSSTDLPLESVVYHVQTYGYGLPSLIDAETVMLSDEGAALMREKIAQWRELDARILRERTEREEFEKSLSVYLRMRMHRFSHSYCYDLATTQHGEIVTEDDIATGKRLAFASEATMGKQHAIRHPALVQAYKGE